jgi:hypothetical protein
MKITFLSALALLFVGLRLTNYIDWSWWLVLMPVWGPFAVFVFFLSLGSGAEWLVRRLETEEQRKARKVREALSGLSKALDRNRT